MEDNKDFVIDTRMPINPPVQEELTETTDKDPSLVDVDSSSVESPIPDEVVDEVLEVNSEPTPIIETEEPATVPETPDLSEVVALIKDLNRKFDEKIAVDEHKNGLFDKLYKERDEYKNDVYAKLLKPFVLGTITLLNDTEVFINNLGEDSAVSAEKFLRSLTEDIINILVSNGVELYEDESETFNPKTQKIVKKMPTDQKEQDGLVAKRVRSGYAWNGVIVYPELVWVYKYSL